MKERLRVLIAAPKEKLGHIQSLVTSGQVVRPVNLVSSWDDLSQSAWSRLAEHKIVICMPFYAEPYRTRTSTSMFSNMLGEALMEHASSSCAYICLIPSREYKIKQPSSWDLERFQLTPQDWQSDGEVARQSIATHALSLFGPIFQIPDLKWTTPRLPQTSLSFSGRPYITHLIRRWLKRHKWKMRLSMAAMGRVSALVSFADLEEAIFIPQVERGRGIGIMLPFDADQPTPEDIDLLVQFGHALLCEILPITGKFPLADEILDWPDVEFIRPEFGKRSFSDLVPRLSRLKEILLGLKDTDQSLVLRDYYKDLETTLSQLIGTMHIIETTGPKAVEQSYHDFRRDFDSGVADAVEEVQRVLSFSRVSNDRLSTASKREVSPIHSDKSAKGPHPDSKLPFLPDKFVEIEAAGEGSFGDVYRARDKDLDRLVAIKVLPEETATNAEEIERLLREARALAKVDHPNIIRIYEIFPRPPRPYIVLEWVDGKPLRECAGDFKTTEERLRFLIQVTSGMALAHGKGVIHRDLSPNNIMVTSERNAKIIDFNLTKLLGAKPVTLSNWGGFGTPNYISPEQLKSSKYVDHRTDIFSLGCDFHFVFADADPLPNASLSEYDEIIGDDLDKMFKLCVQRKPEDRPQTMNYVQSALVAMLEKWANANQRTAPGSSGLVAQQGVPSGTAKPQSNQVITKTPSAPHNFPRGDDSSDEADCAIQLDVSPLPKQVKVDGRIVNSTSGRIPVRNGRRTVELIFEDGIASSYTLVVATEQTEELVVNGHLVLAKHLLVPR